MCRGRGSSTSKLANPQFLTQNLIGSRQKYLPNKLIGSICNSWAWLMDWLATCIGHGRRADESGAVSGLGFEHR